ncbi:hypothetical protein [Halofilum ochraceum]|uniref:hypothetical protein n=1 Tax=Halofilum ochraceum TaxID=1611323 RepID=UPI00111311BE|nr:hypothetical protein [Halofilum ochraceum]
MDNPYRRDQPGRGDRTIRGCGYRPSSVLPSLAAAVLLLAAIPVSAAGPSLFTTPEQRERLDRIRAEATAEELAREPEPEPEPAATAAPKPPPRVHLRGFVRRSKGPSAVWVNSGNTLQGTAVGEGLAAGRVEGATVVVTLPDGKQVRLKPGQTWDPESGEVVDVQGD